MLAEKRQAKEIALFRSVFWRKNQIAYGTRNNFRLLLVVSLGGLLLLYPLSLWAMQAASKDMVNPAIVPQDRLQESWWAQRHQAVLDGHIHAVTRVEGRIRVGSVFPGKPHTKRRP